jgi:hypothetical protein
VTAAGQADTADLAAKVSPRAAADGIGLTAIADHNRALTRS